MLHFFAVNKIFTQISLPIDFKSHKNLNTSFKQTRTVDFQKTTRKSKLTTNTFESKKISIQLYAKKDVHGEEVVRLWIHALDLSTLVPFLDGGQFSAVIWS